jgi:hypothetical protein
MEKPKQLENIDLTALKKICQDYIDNLSNDCSDDDEEHYIYETAMETIFGKNVWKYINEKLK